MDIGGNKVILRAVEEQDRKLLQDLAEDPKIIKVTGGYSHPTSYDHQIKWFRSMENSANRLYRIIADRNTPQIGLGIIILSDINRENGTAEIYIKLIRSACGNGYGQDAVNILVAYGFRELRLTCICSHILEDNRVSRRLFEKCGFKQEAVHKSRMVEDGHYRNVCVYGIRADQVLPAGKEYK